mgnify:CR=1 FL=1
MTLPSPLPGLARVIAARDEIRGVCSAFGVHRLWLFGSAMRPDFHPERSDFDFQVEWLDAAPRRPWQGQLLALRDALAQRAGEAFFAQSQPERGEEFTQLAGTRF